MSSDSQATSIPAAELPPFARWPEGAEIKTFKSTCHCRKFTFEIDHPSLDEKPPLCCNCTFCTKTGTLNIFAPEKFLRFTDESAPREELLSFRAKARPNRHHFCPGCGCYLFWAGMGLVGVNVRMFDGIEVAKLTTVPVDGRSLL